MKASVGWQYFSGLLVNFINKAANLILMTYAHISKTIWSTNNSVHYTKLFVPVDYSTNVPRRLILIPFTSSSFTHTTYPLLYSGVGVGVAQSAQCSSRHRRPSHARFLPLPTNPAAARTLARTWSIGTGLL